MLSQTLWLLMHRTFRDKVLVEEWILGDNGRDGREACSAVAGTSNFSI